MDRTLFARLCDDLHQLLFKKDTKFRKAIPVNKRVAIGLYFLKSGVDFTVLADIFCIGESTAQSIVHEFLDAVAQKYKSLIKFPTEEEKEIIAEGYASKWQYYNCFGALDGSHIPVLPPQENAQEYYCYKSFHSINALALCDDKYCFRYVLTGAPGSCNDPSILNRSTLFEKMEQQSTGGPSKFHIISDAIFPLKTWLMNPYEIRNHMPIIEENFNHRLSSARMTIKGSFGRLKARWRVLLRKPDIHITTMRKVIYVCFLLHNFCQFNEQQILDKWMLDSQREEEALHQEVREIGQENNIETADISPFDHSHAVAKQIRADIARKLFNDKQTIF